MGKMHGQSHIFLLTFMVAVAIPISLAFNIDIKNPDVYTGEQKDFFGYKVLQFMNGENKGIIVTAPLQLNGSGGICKPDQNQTTKCFNPEDPKIPVKHLGLSIAEDSNRSQFTVCSPSVVRECYGNSYMNSVCYKITDHLEPYDDANIIRFVIGVGNIENMTTFKGIASEPIGKYVFKIDNYDGLTGILENFQKKIFTMDGSKVAWAGEMTNEMSQSGFSAVFYKVSTLKNLDTFKIYVLSITIQPSQCWLTFIRTGTFKQHHFVLFTHDGTYWTTTQRINGEQIGSYFGAELCSVDVNSDGNTDFLLVGAPLFYQPLEKKEGQIYIYTLTDEMKLERKLTMTAPSMGRFGTTISSLADLNGDGLRDVAVGAPLQDFNRGVVYIYLGDRHRGIRSTFSQRIMGQKIKPGLRFFGQAIAGNIDLGKDGLPDIVVGSQGTAVVLRSRPIFNVTTRLSFEPNEIRTEKSDCLDHTDANLPMVTLQACFEIVETTKSKAAAMDLGLNISYTLKVDANRQNYRGFFSQTAKKARILTSTCKLRDPDTCFNYTIYMPKCVKDTLLPIIIKLNFSQVNSESASAVLNMDSKTQAFVQVHFEKHCRKNDICIAELEVDFNFMTPTLLVAENKYFNVSVTLSNHGDDSYYTSLIMHYPPGLSFSRMTLTKATRPTLHSCEDLHGEREKTICYVSPPVFRSKSSATFRISFHILKDYEWNDTLLMTITGKSHNTNRTISQTKHIPVQFEIKMAVAVKEDLVTYLNFTPEDAGPKKMVAIYKPQHHFGITQKRSGNIPTETMTEVRVEFIIPPNKGVIIATGAAMGLLLLLIITVIMFKLGCFKRKRLEYCEVQEEETAPQDGIPATSTTGTTQGICGHPETDSKSDQPSEHQSLFDDGEANCSTSSVHS
ncbi:integrin alpha-M-like [Etheostoma cragini]|uniref:integrin alpha-M-like n=1 Tax=Etheostoma cragini TaxID=417921 RepID=UPI00155E0F91|nr:integrin alpha-M-like [Etheostoma cragini]